MRSLKINPISLGINHARSNVRSLRTQPRDIIPESHEHDLPPDFGLATPRQVRPSRQYSYLALLWYCPISPLACRLSQSVCNWTRKCKESSLCCVGRMNPSRFKAIINLQRCSVFNHYNRVRANLEYQEPDEDILYGSEGSGTDQGQPSQRSHSK